LEEIAANFKMEKQPAKALETLNQANQLKSTPDHNYQVGLILQEEHRAQEAIPYLEKAVAASPENNKYKVALGYAYLDPKKYREAAPLFEEVLRSDPDYLKLYGDLAYCYMHAVQNDQAVDWFKRAIDNQPLYPVATGEEAERLRQELYRYRKEVSKITNRYDFTAYLSYQTAKAGQSVAPGGLGAGPVPSQGGVEFAYQPPEIGFRDERIFQIFTRILWNIKPGSMRFDEDSFQGGVGLRYKPLKTQNFYLWGERLFKIGDKALDDWLLRLLYSWDYGYDLKPGQSWWNYTFLYGDAAYFTKAPGTWSYYAEIRQGVTFNLNDSILLTPHLVVDARYQDPLLINSSYLEAGAGVSVKFLLLETRYEVHRASFEILAYYKHGNFLNRSFKVSGDKYDGFFLTGIFHF
jgi:adsorption protein A